jgi:tetratricopeptide (TPR) repeat protein
MSDNPELKPFSQPPTFSSDPNASRFKLIALIGFVILLVGAFAVVIILPGLSAKQRDPAQVTPEAEPVRSEMIVDEESASKAMEAQETLQKILKLQARLENEGVKVWGAEPLVTSYKQVLTSLAEADAYLDDQLFDQASKGYRETIVKLEQLAASRPERMRRAMQAGDEAFVQLDSKLAKQHYEIALAADPANSEAQVGLQRANNLPQVLEHIAQGQFHEGNGSLDLARQMYNNAISLDKDFQSARDHLRDVDELILDRDFRRSMSDAISALNQEEIERARHALDIARNLRPDTAGVRDLEQQLKNIELRIELQRLGKQALQYEQTEEWEMAAKVYSSVLKIDANAGFAQQGKLRAERFIELNRQVQNYLSNPDDLQAPEHMSQARKLYEMAVVKSDIGPKFRNNTEKLHHLIEMYNKPISILVQSDGLTDVRIYRVGRLGHFLEHRLKLQPGRYKALGVRSGYRDASVLFTVPVASEEITLTVYCKEKI